MDESNFELVMPFITTKSVGGPHDDDSYVAGWEMGELSYELRVTESSKLVKTVHAENVAQIDLLAMKYGFSCTFTPQDNGWVWVELSREKMTQAEETTA